MPLESQVSRNYALEVVIAMRTTSATNDARLAAEFGELS